MLPPRSPAAVTAESISPCRSPQQQRRRGVLLLLLLQDLSILTDERNINAVNTVAGSVSPC